MLQCLEDNTCESEDDEYPSEAECDSDAHDDDQSLGNLPVSFVNINPVPMNMPEKFQWTKTGTLKQLTFKKNQELLVLVSDRGTPIDFFRLIIVDTWWW